MCQALSLLSWSQTVPLAKKFKDLVDHIKAIQSSLSSQREQKPLFKKPSFPGQVRVGYVQRFEVEASNIRSNRTGTDSTREKFSVVRIKDNLKHISQRNRLKCNCISTTSKDRKSCIELLAWVFAKFSKLLTSQKAATFYKQLEVANKRSLGSRSSMGLPHRIHVQVKRPHPPVTK